MLIFAHFQQIMYQNLSMENQSFVILLN